MDVAGALVEGVLQQELYGAHHVAVGPLDLVPQLQADKLLQVPQVDGGPHLGLGRLHRGAEPEELPQYLQDVVPGGEHPPELHPLHALQFLDHLVVEGVGDREGDGPVGKADRHDQML